VIVYVETNFILELAFEQAEHGDCVRIIELAENKHIELVLPGYSIGESYEKLIRNQRDRKQLSRSLEDGLKELGRSASYTDKAKRYANLASRLLIGANDQESERLEKILQRLLNFATIIPTDRELLKEALAAQRLLSLKPQDSIVYASVRQRVMQENSAQCFINKNTKDFLLPRITEEFERHGCTLIPAFAHGVKHVDASLAREADAARAAPPERK
jgi:predicted nucleic acid-binding protein